MKRYIAISFLLVYLFSTTIVSELLKIPFLVEHFTEHKTENQSIGFLDFMVLHYMSGAVADADHEKDMKLPFKTVNLFSSSVSIGIPQQCNFIVLSIFQQPKNQNTNNYYAPTFVSTSYLNAIWQPPQFI